MQRVASLYLPDFAIDRLRRAGRAAPARAMPPECAPEAASDAAPGAVRDGGWRPGARWARSEEARETIVSQPLSRHAGLDRASGDGAQGADAAQDAWLACDAVRKAALAAEIATLPAHRRPAPRELGRSDRAAPIPFRAMPADEAGGLRVPDLDRARIGDASDPATRKPRGYQPEGAFWHTGRTIGQTVGVRRGKAPPPAPPPATDTTLPPLVTAPLVTAPLVTAPLATGLRDGARIVVAAACPAARAQGIVPGMAMTLARAMLPGLDVRDADPAGDAAALARLADHAARRWSPIAAVDDSGGAEGGAGLWLDMGVAPLFGGERAMCRRILRWLARRGYAARIAVAGAPGAAHALARHAAKTAHTIILCPPGAEPAALAALPPAALRIAPAAAATLARLGVTDVAALAALPRAPLARRFGSALVRRLDEATGAVPEPIAAVVPPATPMAEVRLVEPIATADAIAQVIDDLAAALAAELLRRGLGARRLVLVCRRVDARDLVETVGLARASRDPRHLARLLAARIERLDPGFGIESARLIAFRAEPLAPETLAPDALASALPGGSAGFAELVDIVAGRIGLRRLYRLGGRESDVPERSLVACAPLGPAPRAHPRWPRPARLLDPPERLDGVTALLPDHPPRRFTWRGRRFDVTQGDGPERIHGEWWLSPHEEHGVRDYFQLETTEGARFWVYRRGDGVDPRTGDLTWHMQGLFG